MIRELKIKIEPEVRHCTICGTSLTTYNKRPACYRHYDQHLCLLISNCTVLTSPGISLNFSTILFRFLELDDRFLVEFAKELDESTETLNAWINGGTNISLQRQKEIVKLIKKKIGYKLSI